jgi:hypothetical protein
MIKFDVHIAPNDVLDMPVFCLRKGHQIFERSERGAVAEMPE